MKTPIRISASQLVLKATSSPSVLVIPAAKVSLRKSSAAVAPLAQASAGLSIKAASPSKSSIPWGTILIGVGVLVFVGIIYYQLKKRRSEISGSKL